MTSWIQACTSPSQSTFTNPHESAAFASGDPTEPVALREIFPVPFGFVEDASLERLGVELVHLSVRERTPPGEDDLIADRRHEHSLRVKERSALDRRTSAQRLCTTNEGAMTVSSMSISHLLASWPRARLPACRRRITVSCGEPEGGAQPQ
jgi:hypothetical protein